MSIFSFVQKAFGKQEGVPKQSKRERSAYVLEKYARADTVVLKIYDAGAFRADWEYLLRIKEVLKSGDYGKTGSLSREQLWTGDGAGNKIFYGIRVRLYILQYVNSQPSVPAAGERLRIVAVLINDGNVPNNYQTAVQTTLFDRDNIPLSALPLIPCELIYP